MRRLSKFFSRLFLGFFRLPLNSSSSLFFFGSIFYFFGLVPLSMAQQLIIESPSPGPLGRVIYGHLSESSVSLFESEHKFELLDPSEAKAVRDSSAEGNLDSGLSSGQATREDQIQNRTSDPLAPRPGNSKTENEEGNSEGPNNGNRDGDNEGNSADSSGISQEGSQVLTSFSLGPSELEKCTEAPRFKGFVGLLKALKPKAVRIVGGSEAEACGKRVMRQISTGTGVSSQFAVDDSVLGLRAEVLVFSPKTVKAAPEKAQEIVNQAETPLVFSSVEEVIRSTKISIGEIGVSRIK